MRNLIKKAFAFVIAANLAGSAGAQIDAHFSQYYGYPAWLNPALTGTFDGEYRVSAIYRSQWAGIGNGFKTVGAAAEINTNKDVSFGVSVFRQTAGTGGYHNTSGYGNLSYSGMRFGKNGYQRVVLGMQVGLLSKGFDRNKVTFEDGYDPITGIEIPNGSIDPVLFNKLNMSSFDAALGALYFDADPAKKANIYAGFSASHVTRPNDFFSGGEGAKLPMRFNAHAGVRIKVSETFSITPNFLYIKQGTADAKVASAYAQFKAAPEVDLLLGGNYRFQDAIIPYVGLYYKNMVIGASYDITTSDLSKAAGRANAFEISLTFTGKRKAKGNEQEFVCPRL